MTKTTKSLNDLTIKCARCTLTFRISEPDARKFEFTTCSILNCAVRFWHTGQDGEGNGSDGPSTRDHRGRVAVMGVSPEDLESFTPFNYRSA